MGAIFPDLYFIMLSFFLFIILLVTLVQYTSLTPADIYKAGRYVFSPQHGFVRAGNYRRGIQQDGSYHFPVRDHDSLVRR